MFFSICLFIPVFGKYFLGFKVSYTSAWFRSPVQKFRQSLPDARTRHCSQLGAEYHPLVYAHAAGSFQFSAQPAGIAQLGTCRCSCILSVPALNSSVCSANQIEKSGSICCDLTHLWRSIHSCTSDNTRLQHQPSACYQWLCRCNSKPACGQKTQDLGIIWPVKQYSLYPGLAKCLAKVSAPANLLCCCPASRQEGRQSLAFSHASTAINIYGISTSPAAKHLLWDRAVRPHSLRVLTGKHILMQLIAQHRLACKALLFVKRPVMHVC